MITREELQNILIDGENSLVEFKSESVNAQSLAEEFVAFANFKGGLLLIGVNDLGEVEGVTKDKMEEFIINVARNNIRPSILPDIQRKKYEEKVIYLVDIPKGDVPHSTTKGQYFIRAGSTKQSPTHVELLRLFQRKNLLHFDELPVYETSIFDIGLDKVSKYIARLGQSELPESEKEKLSQLKAMRILSPSETENYHATISGLLTFGKNVQKHYPSYEIRCGAYKGNSISSSVVQEKNCDGTLDQQIESALAFLKFHIPQNQQVEDVRRSDEWRVPVAVMREALVNAVCHRDYSIEGSAIRVFVFPSRLEIQSPGGLSNSLSLEELPYQQNNRNQAIASFLSGLGFAERRGKGILIMQKLSMEANINFGYNLVNGSSAFSVFFDWNN